MINYEPHPNEQVVDTTIVTLLNKGHTQAEVFEYILFHCSLSLVTNKQKQAMCNLIAQIDTRNLLVEELVMGNIPDFMILVLVGAFLLAVVFIWISNGNNIREIIFTYLYWTSCNSLLLL